jgi:lysophospholipase L1-like esterase
MKWFRRRKPTRVLCIGDSVTAGVVVGGGDSYVDVLRGLLRNKYVVFKRGGSGTSCLDWVRPPVGDLPVPFGGAYEKLASAFMPSEVVVVELGWNDAVSFWERKATPIELFRSSMLELVWRLKDDGAERVIVLTPLPNPGANASAKGRLLSYRLALLGSFWPLGVSVLDVYRLLDIKEDFTEFNPHPNSKGHRKIAEAVAKRIRGRWRYSLWA